MIEVIVEEPIGEHSPGIDLDQIRRMAVTTLRLHALSLATHTLTIVITNNEKIRALNRQYRQVDAATDVLSFTANEEDPADGVVYLGDVVISYEKACENLDERLDAWQEADLEDELLLLTVHGVLHLLDYDHADPEEEAHMWAKQDAILKHRA